MSGIALGYDVYDRGSESRQELWIFLWTPHPDQLWGPLSLLSKGHDGIFLWG